MSEQRFVEILAHSIERANLDVSDGARAALAAYLTLLSRWNRKINLTAFDLDDPTDQAMERLVIEPLRASRLITDRDRSLVDIGSGGGSPAVPLAIQCRHVRLTMIEVRERKAAFLREAVRTIGLDASVEARRFEEVVKSWPAARVDVISCRAVRPDEELWDGIDGLLARTGRLFWFGVGRITDSRFKRSEISTPSELAVFERAPASDLD